ncbi:MAG TPA: beta-propeller fold lactonase family protein, partial [Bryobacteraceae bacterium]|nr:beta-propeller fold lactonase family protein [Bryobacteraceae bacterium]
NIIDHPDSVDARITTIPPTTKPDPQVQVHAGVAYSPDGRLLYDATGESGAVDVWSTDNWQRVNRIALDKDAFASNLALSRDGRFLYVVDQGNWRIAVIDTAVSKLVTVVPTGANPLAIAISEDGRRLYFTNSGLFEYTLINGARKEDTLSTGLHFPPFGYPSKEARRGVLAEGRKVAGLGSENDPRGSSLWTVDISNPNKPAIVSKLRLGHAIGSGRHAVVGGASPSGVIADARHVYVTLAHEDGVAVISPDGKTLESQIALTPFSGADFQDRSGRPLRGVMPLGLAQDASRLYVTEAGINAVALIEKESGRVLGHTPTGWLPAAAAVSGDGKKLYVVNNKGKGAGPNGGAHAPSNGRGPYIGELELGSLSVIDLPLRDGTAAVLQNNLAARAPNGKLPPLKHVFFIIRENRTYDEVLGDLPDSDGDASLARFGLHGWTEEEPKLKDVSVTPNAHALVRRFATSDRFFVDSDVSADGHRWAFGIAPTPWLDMAWTAGYADRRNVDPFSSAPGRRALGGGSDSPMPEDEPEYGSLWEHIASAGLSIRNYGEGIEVEGADERDGAEPEGQRLLLNAPVPMPVFESSDRAYPTFNLGIPDQFRFQEFAKDMDRRLKKGKVAAFTVIRLPNDHTSDPRPQDGYRYRASFVADNDLALGKIVDKISHSAIWKDTAIFVIEDDAQGGVDHVDAHRSPVLVISPYARKGFISHRHCSMASVQKTIYELLEAGPLNLEDALAADMSDVFSDTPDPTPFTALPSDRRIFDPALARFAKPKTKAEARKLLEVDNPRVIQEELRRSAQSR